MVKHQAVDGWFDIHHNAYIGAQAHGVRALGVTLPLLGAHTTLFLRQRASRSLMVFSYP